MKNQKLLTSARKFILQILICFYYVCLEGATDITDHGGRKTGKKMGSH